MLASGAEWVTCNMLALIGVEWLAMTIVGFLRKDCIESFTISEDSYREELCLNNKINRNFSLTLMKILAKSSNAESLYL